MSRDRIDSATANAYGNKHPAQKKRSGKLCRYLGDLPSNEGVRHTCHQIEFHVSVTDKDWSMEKKNTAQTQLTPAVLHILLALSAGKRHGYGIMK